MSGKTKKLVNQEGRERYGNEAVEGATSISQGSKKFFGADDEFEAARAEENTLNAAHAEESATRARSQRVGNLGGHATGTANERDEDKAEGKTAGNRRQPERNPVEPATGDVKIIFRGGNG